MNRQRTIGIALLVGLVLVAVIGWTVLGPAVGVVESQYGYSVAVATNATLTNLTILVPLPADDDEMSPIADRFVDGAATVPGGWQASVVGTERGLMLRLTAGQVPAEPRSDGRHYSTYQVSAAAPADRVIDTGSPFGPEPTVAHIEGRREVPCPNVVGPSAETCYRFETAVFARYDAPPDAEVDLQLVAAGANEFVLGGRAQYYERVLLRLDGPQDGWVLVEGFASTD